MMETQLVLFDWSKDTGSTGSMDGSVLEEKSSFKMLGLTLSSKLDWALTWSLLSKLSKEIGALICSVKFLSPEVALYLYKSTIWSSMEYCYHVWAGTLCCYFVRQATKTNMQGCWSFTCCLS